MLSKMLRSRKIENVLLIGSTSEIGIEIINKLNIDSNSQIFLMGRREPESELFQNASHTRNFIYYDFLKEEDLQNFASDLEKLPDIDLAILAIGYLPPENSELDLDEILKTYKINALASSLILSILVRKMARQANGKILLLSSVASMRPRIANFVYGSSKKTADFFAVGLINKYRTSTLKISILRPGFVFTKLSRNFKAAPFSRDKYFVAETAVQGLMKEKAVIYVPNFLKYVMFLLSLTPRFIYNRLR